MGDTALAQALAHEAGRLLLHVRGTSSATGDELKTEGDKRSHDLLATELARLRPDDAVRSEEEVYDDPRRASARRVWIVDPLDGTREFAEPPRTDWAVHVALWEDGDLVAGAVALPALDVVLSNRSAPALPPPAVGPLRLVVSRTRPPALAGQVAARLGAELVPMGSAGAKIMAVVRGEADAYLHAGGQYEWDSAAPVVVARSVGLHTSRLDGSPLIYNRPDPWQPDLLVCRPEVTDLIRSAVAEAVADATSGQ